MPGRGDFEFVPGRKHRCSPPDPEGSDRATLPLGTVWKCLDGFPACGKRWRVAHVDDAFGGCRGWVRRWLPWHPILGVEHLPSDADG